MFNNIVLDVAIGLIFIYMLYSLLASTINEFVALIFAYRHRMLEKAIEQMLDGKNYSYYWWDKLINLIRWYFFRRKEERYKNNRLEGTQLNKKDFFQTKAINDKDAFDYLEERKKIIKEKKVNKSDIQKQFEDDNENYIKRAKLNKKASLFAANIINHPLYRRKSEQSLFFKKPAYLSASAFSDILFDVLSNRRSKINATPILMNDIKTFVSNQLQNKPGLRSILNMYVEQANGDVQKFKLLLEDWFDDTMNRVSGWYKRQATKILFVIGLMLAMTFNVNTIEIVHRLSVNKDLRETLAKSASAYVENANKNRSTGSQPGGSQTQTKNPADTSNIDSAFAKAQQQIEIIKKLYYDSIAEINIMMGLGWDSSVLLKNFVKGNQISDGKWRVSKDSMNWLNKSLQWLLPRWMFNGYYIGLSVIRKSFIQPILILGFIITALAVSLGSPFWFDLLNKFVNIRAGGNKPSEDANSSGGSDLSKTAILNQKPASNSFA